MAGESNDSGGVLDQETARRLIPATHHPPTPHRYTPPTPPTSQGASKGGTTSIPAKVWRTTAGPVMSNEMKP